MGVDRVPDSGALPLRPRTTAGCNGFPSWLTTSSSSRSIRSRSSVAAHPLRVHRSKALPPKAAGGSSRRHPNALAGGSGGAKVACSVPVIT